MKPVFVLIGLVFCFYFLFGLSNFLQYGVVANNQDWTFHFVKSQGLQACLSVFQQWQCTYYQPVYHSLFSVFAVHPLMFYFVNLVLILVFIPLLLLELFKSKWGVAVYFGGCALCHAMIYGSLFPQALVLVWFLGYLLYRKWWAWLVFGVCAMFTHSYGLYLFLAIAFIEVLLQSKKVFFAIAFIKQNQMDLHHFGITLLSLIPLPVLFFGLRQAKENALYLGLILISFFMSFAELRTLCVAQILLCGLAGQNIEKTNWKIKKGFVLFLLVESVFYVLEFVFGTWKYIVLN